MKRRGWIALGAAAAIVLGACGTGDDGGDDDGLASPAQEATPSADVTGTGASTVQSASPSPSPSPSTPAPTAEDVCATPGLEGLAFIFVTAPAPGAQVSSGDSVEGCANTFEAAYRYELLAPDGSVLDDGFGTATCGTGCVGTFSFPVTFSVSQVEVGTLRVFADSAQDGSPVHVNAIPVLLQP